ncbi:GNAT family N-acetyltransferase [Clostridium sp. ATCC 25772]|uniref:GNAT family N-acetyltransferase n=1 Tax=Clostridium sp. ATCC 25772 TaxID=1676991 RepID=UPI000783C0DD|nr:GNAT family N-acetyltransferase [Clostridium sp. ATCC 25772]
MEYKKLESSDIDGFVENRIEFVTSIRNIENVDLFREKTIQYIKKHINSNSLIIYVAVDNKKIVSSCMLCIFETIPLPSGYNGKMGELLNVYTKQAYRRQVHSANLIKLLIGEAKLKGISKIVLDYTDEGYSLYKSLGFKDLDRKMEYRL